MQPGAGQDSEAHDGAMTIMIGLHHEYRSSWNCHCKCTRA